jgi:hypothetical protein
MGVKCAEFASRSGESLESPSYRLVFDHSLIMPDFGTDQKAMFPLMNGLTEQQRQCACLDKRFLIQFGDWK